MAVMTVYEQAKRLDPDGTSAKIAEILVKKNTVWKDAPAIQANDQNSHVSTIRASHIVPSIRRINQGAQRTLSRTRQQRDEIMLIEDWVEIDEKIMEIQADRAAFRFGEIKAHLAGMAEGFHDHFWYGGGAEIGEVTGLSNRFYDLGMDNVVGAGGTGSDLSSVWFIEWGEELIHLIYPRGAQGAGVEDEDKGKMTLRDPDGNPYDGYANKLRLQFGTTIKDERAVQRVANVESLGELNNLTVSTVQHDLIRAVSRLPGSGDNAVMYVNRALKAQIDIMCFDKGNAAFNYAEVSGKRVSMFMEIPIRLQESLLDSETAIV